MLSMPLIGGGVGIILILGGYVYYLLNENENLASKILTQKLEITTLESNMETLKASLEKQNKQIEAMAIKNIYEVEKDLNLSKDRIKTVTLKDSTCEAELDAIYSVLKATSF